MKIGLHVGPRAFRFADPFGTKRHRIGRIGLQCHLYIAAIGPDIQRFRRLYDQAFSGKLRHGDRFCLATDAD